MAESALSGVKVVEYAQHLAVPYCAKVLADLGAEVVKVENPKVGDLARQWGPFPADQPDLEQSGLFLALNGNKMGVTLDVNSPEGRHILVQLLRQADVFIHDLSSAQQDTLGFSYPSLSAEVSNLIFTVITPYGSSGPYKDYKGTDLTVNAAGGSSHGIGSPEREPLRMPLFQASHLAGLAAATATTMALLYRDTSGNGQLVDISESDVIAVLIDGIHLPTYIYRGVTGHRNGRRALMGRFPNTLVECQDGWICLHGPQLEQYLRFFKMIGEPEWGENPRYRDRRKMAEEYPDEAEALLAPWFKSHTKQEVLEQLMEYHVPGAPVATVAEVFNSPHLRKRDFFAPLSHHRAGPLKYPVPPYRLSGSPGELRCSAPTLGQHNEEVFVNRLGLKREELTNLSAAGVI